MATIDVKNIAGQKVGSINLSDAVFAAEINEHLLWEVVKWQLAKRRSGTHSTKRMSEVRGSSIKPYKQKGTGQARQGSFQAPQFVGGGSVFGPKPRSYEYKMPKKAKRLALCSALSLRANEKKLIVLDKFETAGKTKEVATALAKLGADRKALIVDQGDNDMLARGARNLEGAKWLSVDGINVYDILRHDTLIMTSEAMKNLEAALGAE
ncbi:MAG: 50S ribosomal protein L4 [Myxococcales bacterium]|nr:50S ribosomal protein L4 [Myxococcales bacterium]